MAAQKPIRAERAEDRVNRSFFEQGFAFVRALQALGDLVAVQVLRRRVEDGEQDQRHQTGVEFLLEFPDVAVVHATTIHLTVLAVN
jgi:hypothetical protein